MVAARKCDTLLVMKDLANRCETFARDVIVMCRGVRQDAVNNPLIDQLVRTATRIGALYYEAQGATTKNDFNVTVSSARKEAAETLYWLKLMPDIAGDDDALQKSVVKLKGDCQELLYIFQTITNRTKSI